VPRERRRARFLTVAALAWPDGAVQVTQGALDGVIAERPTGSHGFGYDPVFFVPALGRTLAELTAEEKNRISHRAEAFRKMRDVLSKALTTGGAG
jgi:XTP/dITP diphosphohydrolase